MSIVAMPDEIWMHIENGTLSCHTRAISPASVAFVPLFRAVKADAQIRALEAQIYGLQRALSFWHPGVPATGPYSIYDRRCPRCLFAMWLRRS
jgi:hypothetical protein